RNRRDSGEVRRLDAHATAAPAQHDCDERGDDEQRQQREQNCAHAWDYRGGAMLRLVSLLTLFGCGPRAVPAGSPDQSIHDAMVLVCDAPSRARGEGGSRSDAIAAHLSDGVGNTQVLTTVEGWKTDGINKRELDRLVTKARLSQCALR